MTQPEYDAWRAKIRRNELANARICINGRSHGKATNGVRCAWCHAVHKFGIVAVFANPDAPAKPVNYRPRFRGAK